MVFRFGDVFGDDFVTADSNPMSKTARNSRKQPKTVNQSTSQPRIFVLPQEDLCVAARGSLCCRKRIFVSSQEDTLGDDLGMFCDGF